MKLPSKIHYQSAKSDKFSILKNICCYHFLFFSGNIYKLLIILFGMNLCFDNSVFKLIIFFYGFIILFHLISSVLHTESFLFLYTYVSIELIDCYFLSSLALNAVLSTSSLNTLLFLVTNNCFDFNINLLYFMNSF